MANNEQKRLMTLAKHTPGPWKADCFLVTAANGREITHVGLLGRRKSSHEEQSGGDECEANARLIAAAPALLAACKAMVEAVTAGTAEQHLYRLAALDAIALTQKEEA